MSSGSASSKYTLFIPIPDDLHSAYQRQMDIGIKITRIFKPDSYNMKSKGQDCRLLFYIFENDQLGDFSHLFDYLMLHQMPFNLIRDFGTRSKHHGFAWRLGMPSPIEYTGSSTLPVGVELSFSNLADAGISLLAKKDNSLH
jgi:hypothetical protein